MSDRIPNLSIESTEEGGFLLEQDWCGNVDRVELHATQVRHLAELAGLVPRGDNGYTPPVHVLARRLRVLLDRIDRLDDMIRAVEAKGHEDLELETTFSYATWELAREFCADLEEPAAGPDASRTVTRSHGEVTRDGAVSAAAETQGKPTGNPAGSSPSGEQLRLEG